MNTKLNEHVLKEIDAYDVILDLSNITNITKGWEVKTSEKGREQYQKQSGKKRRKLRG